MKNLYAKLSGFSLAASLALYSVVPVFAEKANLCPSDSGITVPGCGGDINITNIISSVISVLLFAAFIIALLFLIVGGIKWILSGGEKDGANKAKETITSALIGLAVVLGSWLLLNVVVQVLTGTNFSNINIPTLNVVKGAAQTN